MDVIQCNRLPLAVGIYRIPAVLIRSTLVIGLSDICTTPSWLWCHCINIMAIITGYQVVFSETDDSSEQGTCQTGHCTLSAGAIRGCCQVSPYHTFIVITGLDPSKDYSVTVSAGNGAGQGEKSEALEVEGELLHKQ